MPIRRIGPAHLATTQRRGASPGQIAGLPLAGAPGRPAVSPRGPRHGRRRRGASRGEGAAAAS
ncbi:hypothetical protein QJS66_18605 [Kocuria rhizophila]|nr:hypothetical protein QJS66_18605 [Kocuria rhizophila]